VKQRKKLLEENATRLLSRKKFRFCAVCPGKQKDDIGGSGVTQKSQQAPLLIELKNLDGNKNKNKEDNALTDSNQLVSAIAQKAGEIFEKDVKSGQNKYEMLWKYAKDIPKERFILELLTSPQEIISSLGKITDSAFHTSMLMYIENLFEEVASKAVEIKETIYNFFADYNDFLAMMLRCLEFLTPNSPEYGRYTDMMVAFGSTFNQDSSGSQILFLENFGLAQLLAFAKRISNKKDALVKILLSICGQEETKRIRLLRRMEKMLGGDYNTLSGLLAHMSIDQAELGFNGEIYEFYWTKAITVINGTCNPKIKAAGLKILNELSIDNYRNLPEVYPTLRRLCTETWWEVKSQILIICANQLNLIEMASREDEIKSQKDRSGLQNTQEHGEETVEAAIPKIDADGGGAHIGLGGVVQHSRGAINGNENNSQMEQTTDKHLRSNLNKSNEGEMEKTQQSFIGEHNEGAHSKSNSIVHLIDLVSRIFHTDANVNVQKVGLVYLAPVLNYYPELCPRFLEVLLSVEDDVRETVLNINQDTLSEYNIVISSSLVLLRFHQLQVQHIWSTTRLVIRRDSRSFGSVRPG
jgi:hypothetical protein